MMQARAIYFDAVGTLIHPVEPVAESYRRIAATHGLLLDLPTVATRMKAAYARQEQIDQAAGWRTDEARELDRWQSIVRDTLPEAPHCFPDLWHYFSQPTAWSVDNDCGESLRSLARAGFVLGIASNFDERLAGILPHLPALAPLAERCVISSLVGWRKPGAGFFEIVARQAQCEPGEVLFVGDDFRNDVEGSRAAGMQAVFFGSGSLSRISDLLVMAAVSDHNASPRN